MESSCTKDGMDTPPARCPLRAASPAHDVTAVTLSSPLGGGLRPADGERCGGVLRVMTRLSSS
eukprot:8068013-Pyramimonas_sp.AAC.2